MLVNHVNRYHVALRALEAAEKRDGDMRLDFVEKYIDFQHRIKKTRDYIYANGQDPEGTYDLPAFEDFTKGSGGGGGCGGGVLSDEGSGSNVTMLRCEFDSIVQKQL
ncbi:Xylulose 5-phosphate/Fructose 6-phosphate phosphoketolase [Neofusicoccum parvum]|uniref:Xylulose 5-phosphate/Fructose 6-phosphate phosphoketolase n=1 Tax=Neofusicoccum parvum TaxID=310453 RepID=A0ACB5RMW5_9PEZI|nr:Xylulose 5-phosphate/Fructose 6-phosphate phosphoketolase [Neofusicoccum parvum]